MNINISLRFSGVYLLVWVLRCERDTKLDFLCHAWNRIHCWMLIQFISTIGIVKNGGILIFVFSSVNQHCWCLTFFSLFSSPARSLAQFSASRMYLPVSSLNLTFFNGQLFSYKHCMVLLTNMKRGQCEHFWHA